jgi:hypothetical protein
LRRPQVGTPRAPATEVLEWEPPQERLSQEPLP